MTPYDEQDFDDARRLIDQRQFFERRPKTSRNVIAKWLARHGYHQQNAANQIQTVWQSLVEATWPNATQAGHLRRGVLEIVVANAALRQRLEFEKSKLLAKLQKQLPESSIKDIRFRIGNVEKNG